ncbi:hypothetical protein ACFIQG_20765 [Comamonas odontotermitis]|uniref:hypothetical protein n=1 Tax=Comamonas odontotermitis TaxID=379895 RepID=UPI00366C7C16
MSILSRIAKFATILLMGYTAWTHAQTLSSQSILRVCTSSEARATQRYWPLANNVMLDFSISGADYTVSNNPANILAETNSAVTDSAGQLLFSVDGGSIFRADGSVMLNGSGLKAQPSAEQGSVAFANPAKRGEYYVFTNNTVTGGFVSSSSDRTWYYSIVDMTANGGLGAVTAKNVQVLGSAGISSEAMTAIPNGAGDGFWVVGIELNTNKIMAFEVKSTGISPIVESFMGYADASVYTSLYFNGDGTRLVAQNRQYPFGVGNISVMDFDKSTGVASNPIVWQVSGLSDYNNLYSSAFSPDGRTLYVSTILSNGTSYLYSYDISSGNPSTIASTQQRITRLGGYGGALHIGPDGALWWANGVVGTVTSDYIYRLANPNTRPADMGTFEKITVNGGGDYSSLGLTQTLPSCYVDPIVIPPEISIIKTSSTPGPVLAKGEVDYVIAVTNVGSVVASQLHLTDSFPIGLKSATWNCTSNGGTPMQSCVVPSGSSTAPSALLDQTFDLQVGATVTYTIHALANDSIVISTENTATAMVPGGAACSKGGIQEASCSVTTPGNTLVPKPAISISKSSSVLGPVAAGESVNYIVSITNVGDVVAKKLRLNDSFPAGLISATWTCVSSGGTSPQLCSASSGSATLPALLLDETLDLYPGGTVTYYISAQVGHTAITSTQNTVVATVPGGAACSKNGPQEVFCSATTPKGQPSIGAGKVPNPIPTNSLWNFIMLGIVVTWLSRRTLA